MTKKIKDLTVKVGEYTAQDGQTKSRYKNVGAMMKNDDGNVFLLLDRTFNPAGVPDFSGKGGEAVIVSVFDLRDNNNQQNGGGQQQRAPRQPQQPQNRPPADDDSDMPF